MLDLFYKKNIQTKSKDRCFILANGPSLLSHDLSLLAGEDIISINAAPMALQKHNIKSKFYCVSDPRFLMEEKKKEIFLNQLHDKDMSLIVRDSVKKYLKENLHINKGLDNIFAIRSLGRDGFSKNIYHGFYFGCSTTYLAIQLAYFLKYSNVYILGLDLNYGFDNYKRFYNEEKVQEFDLLVSVQLSNYYLARKIFQDEGRGIFVCNKNSWASLYINSVDFDSLFL